MKNNTAFSKIKIDSANRKKERFPLTHSINTTAAFGECQPMRIEPLIANTKAVSGLDALVRLTPMVAPTFADIKYKVWHHFVGMSDLLRSYTKFLVNEPYGVSGEVRKQGLLPRMRLCDLSIMALLGCRFTVYVQESEQASSVNSSEWLLVKDSSDMANAFSTAMQTLGYVSDVRLQDSRYPGYSGCMVSPSMFSQKLASNIIPVDNQCSMSGVLVDAFDNNPDLDRYHEVVSLQSADLVFQRKFTIAGVQSQPYAFAVRLSAFGKRLRKILLAAGYKLNFTSVTPVSVLPIMAYYKAYFDTFGLTLYQNYESTNANVLLQSYDQGDNLFDWGNAYFCHFVYDLGNCFMTDEQDFISAHQKTDAISPRIGNGYLNNIVLSPNYNGQDLAKNMDQAPNTSEEYGLRPYTNHVFIDKVNHTEVDAEILKRLYKVTNRNTIAGRRIEELLRAAGYGQYVDEQKSNFIGYTEVKIDVSDINATADGTNEATGRNSTLGQYVGKGVGYDSKAGNKTFTFECKEAGFWVTIAAIVPNSGYCQGIDQRLYDVDRFDVYNAEFDGLGMEFSRKSVVMGAEDWHDDEDEQDFDASFGLVPRYSRYKVTQDLANGDFSLRGTREGYLPYMLDKFIECNDRFVDEVQADDDGRHFVAYEDTRMEDLPIAGNSWRYNSRYPWLNNYERIFTSFLSNRDVKNPFFTAAPLGSPAFELTYNFYDGFIVQAISPFTAYAPMLAIADSYGTTDDNDGHGDMTMGKA